MQAADLQVIRDIPGYKAILKTVLRTQIQQLVEQLADQTGEESVLLTASVSDGTLSHLGSKSGRVFLEDHDDIKSQFLGFCLKRHRKQKQREKKTQQENIPDHGGTRHSHGPRPRKSPTHVHTSPYSKKTDPSASPSHSSVPSPTQSIQSPAMNDEDSDSSTVIDEPTEVKYRDTIPPEGLRLDSDSSNLPGIPTETSKMDTSESKTPGSETGTSEVDPNVNVKIEAITESELDLEIASEETGQMPQSKNSQMQMQNIKQRNANGPSTSAGAQGDMSAVSNQGFKMSKEPRILEEPLEASYHEDVASGSSDMPSEPEASCLENAPKLILTAELNCNVCKRHFQTRDGLVSHFKKHTKKFFCRKCTQAFVNKESLENHNSVKHGQNFLCSACGKTLHGKQSLLTHMTVHEGKRFSCPYRDCGKKFLTQKFLTDHINTHAGLQPHECNTCSAKFCRSGSLTRHKMSCGRSISCPICKKNFTSYSMLTDHKLTEHKKKVFKCACGKRFKWRSSLCRHNRKCNYTA